MRNKTMNDDEKYNEKGLEYFKARQYEKALEYFNKAINIKNDNADYYRNRAYCYYEMKQFELGDKDFNEASLCEEIDTALNRIYADRFVTDVDNERYLQTLIKYKEDSRFAERIKKILKLPICKPM